MPRPLKVPLFATALVNRIEPLSGTQTTGYAKNDIPMARHFDWLVGYSGDWCAYLDAFRWGLDFWQDNGNATLIRGTGVSFTVGGPLAQRPVTGGVYVGRRERLDCTEIGASAPVYTFAPNTAPNYVFIRGTTTRDAYPDILIQAGAVPPSAEWRLIRQVTTNAISVTSDFAPLSLEVGYKYIGPWTLTGVSGTTTLAINVDAASAPGVLITALGGSTQTLVQCVTNSGQTPIVVRPIGALTPGHNTTIDSAGVAGYKAFSSTNTSDNVGYLVDTPSLGQTFALAMKPHSAVPANGANWTAYTRLYATIQSFSGGFRWRDASASNFAWTPHAHRHTSMVESRTTAADIAYVGGQALVTIVTLSNVAFLTDHVYHIHVECEATPSLTKAFVQTVTIDINTVADADWNARIFDSPATGTTGPWLSTHIHYKHTTGDTTAAIRLRIQHSAGGGSLTYVRPRICVFGPFSV